MDYLLNTMKLPVEEAAGKAFTFSFGSSFDAENRKWIIDEVSKVTQVSENAFDAPYEFLASLKAILYVNEKNLNYSRHKLPVNYCDDLLIKDIEKNMDFI